MRFSVTAASAPGAGFQQNDDRVFVATEHSVYAIADGTGGHGRAADVLLYGIQTHLTRFGKPRSIDDLEAAVRTGELALIATTRTDSKLCGAGTTLDIVAMADSLLLAIHVGDGRIYHHRNGIVTQLSIDHTWVETEVRAGRLRPEDAEAHPHRNVVTRAFIGGDLVQLDTLQHPFEARDVVVLCTDGIWKTFGNGFLTAAVTADDAAIADMLYEKRGALNRSPRCVDNATLVVVRGIN